MIKSLWGTKYNVNVDHVSLYYVINVINHLMYVFLVIIKQSKCVVKKIEAK